MKVEISEKKLLKLYAIAKRAKVLCGHPLVTQDGMPCPYCGVKHGEKKPPVDLIGKDGCNIVT